MQAAQQADWKKNGLGGIVTAVDAASGTVTITSGAKKIAVETTGKTEFKLSLIHISDFIKITRLAAKLPGASPAFTGASMRSPTAMSESCAGVAVFRSVLPTASCCTFARCV